MWIAIPDVVVARPLSLVFDPLFHGAILVLKYSFIAVTQVHRPRYNYSRIGPRRRPAGGSAGPAENIRNNVRNAARLELIARHIFEPFCIERRDVHIKLSRRGKRLGITGPSHALIALRAVGRNIKEISFLAPNN